MEIRVTDYGIVTAREEEFEALCQQVQTAGGPDYLNHDVMVDRYWPLLAETFPDHQFCLVERQSGAAVAIGNSIPLAFSGQWSNLPEEGLDWALEKGFLDHTAGRSPNMMSALYIIVDGNQRGKSVSAHALAVMKQIGVEQGFEYLIAPVRPWMKSRYPMIDMEDYLSWQTAEGYPFDPWLRVHVRGGWQGIAGVSQGNVRARDV